MDSPGSPLSETLSDAPASLRSLTASPEPESRPTKRQRTSAAGAATSRTSTSKKPQKDMMENLDDTAIGGLYSDADISSDTDGSVSGSVHGIPVGMDDEDDKAAAGGKEQISVCRWEDCDAGDQGNMDVLVKHLHEEHIHARQKKYSCEWMDCSRKGHPHASGYALRAHMRSHTREKPFYCTLPECDRSFTRSDALAKHMRTVHETEALRPSDPVPKHHSSNPTNKVQRIKLTFNKFSAGLNGTKDEEPVKPSKRKTPDEIIEPLSDREYANSNVLFFRDESRPGGWRTKFPVTPDFREDEKERLSGPQLYALMKKQIQWALEERNSLDQQLYAAERRRKGEWIAKEMVLADAIGMAQAAAPDDDEEEADIGAETIEDEDVLMETKSRNEDDDDETIMHPETSPPPALLPPLPYSNAPMSLIPNTNGIPIGSRS